MRRENYFVGLKSLIMSYPKPVKNGFKNKKGSFDTINSDHIRTTDGDNKIKNFSVKPVEKIIPLKNFLSFFNKEIRIQSISDYTTGLGVRMGKTKGENDFNIGLEAIFYKKQRGNLTAYKTLPKETFFGRLINNFDNIVSSKEDFLQSLKITDTQWSTIDSHIKPAEIAIIELDAFDKFIEDISYVEDKDLISFAFARGNDNRITVVVSIKRENPEGKLDILIPNTHTDYAYLDVHDLIPPPSAES